MSFKLYKKRHPTDFNLEVGK